MSTRRGRRAEVAATAVVASVLAALGAPPASADHRSDYTTNCPPPESLVSGTTWHGHHLAPGVTLKEGQRRDSRGAVDMHVLDVDVTNRHLTFAPLAHQMAQRTPLSVLAAGHSNLVAATNTGFFDFAQGTPLGPLVDRGRPWVTSSKQATVVGFNKSGAM